LGMAYGPTQQSWPTGLYKPCPLLEWDGSMQACIVGGCLMCTQS